MAFILKHRDMQRGLSFAGTLSKFYLDWAGLP